MPVPASTDCRLIGCLELLRLDIDVLELRIAVRMMAAVLGLTVDVTAILQLLQQLRHA